MDRSAQGGVATAREGRGCSRHRLEGYQLHRERETHSAPYHTRGWRGVSFVGGKKATLHRLFREKGISLKPEAQARFDALPEQFLDFVAAPASFAAQWPEAA